MIKIAQAVEEIIKQDDLALAAAQKGWLNFSAYARSIKQQVEELTFKDVQEGSIVTALTRVVDELPPLRDVQTDTIQSLAVHSNLEGMTYERSDAVSEQIKQIYHQIAADNKTYLTVTQGINEVTVVAESRVAKVFREQLQSASKIYDKKNLVGITVKFDLRYLEIPNLIFALTKRLAYKSVNIIEIVSTATELTYIIDKKDLPIALEQLQKDI